MFDDAIAVTGGGSHTCAIRQDGALYCWGDNAFGQLGVPQATALASPKPLKVQFPASLGGARITQVVLGEKTTFAIDAELRLWVFGNNESAYRADGTKDTVPHPEPQMVLTKPGGAPMLVRQVAPLWYSTCALTTTGEIYCWGQQIFSGANWRTLGPDAPPSDSNVPVKGFSYITPPTANAVLARGTGSLATCYASGLSNSNALVCWGTNSLGGVLATSADFMGANYSAEDPLLKAGAVAPPIDVQFGTNFTCSRDAKSEIFCWGTNPNQGQHETMLPSGVAAKVPNGPYTALSTGYIHYCAVDAQQQIRCRGDNGHMQLGRPTPKGLSDQRLMNPVVSTDGKAVTGFVKVGAGFFHTCAITQGPCGPEGPGTVYCWGSNESQQSGGAVGVNTPSPVAIAAP